MERSAALLKVPIDQPAIAAIAERARRTPRVANRLLKRCRDLAQVEGRASIDEEIVVKSLDMLEIDEVGLDAQDRKILKVLIERFNGGPAGIQAIAASSAEEEETILEVFEPYLLRLGFLTRTPRGRMVTKIAWQHLGFNPPPENPEEPQNEQLL